MSKDYAISTVLDLEFSEYNIINILKKGYEKGFIYYHHILGERYQDSPILNPEQAAYKIMQARINKIEGGPSVYSKIEDIYVYIWFYETDQGNLEIYLGGFGAQKKKRYEADFAYFIKIILDICDDYPIISLCTATY